MFEAKSQIKDLARSLSGDWVLSLTVRGDICRAFDQLKDKPLRLSLKPWREKRSLDANAYCWVLMQKLADAVGSDKEAVYLDMLQRYGVFTHLVVKSNVVERVKAEWRTVRELGPVTINGQTGIQLQCYFGSSTYDTREMSRLLDGIISECKELGIATDTPQQIALMKERWGQ